jgi:hypothetical protein
MMPIFDFECPECHIIREELILLKGTDIISECGTKMDRKFPTTTAIRFGDSFIVGTDKPSKEVSQKIEEFQKHPEKDPYGRWRG